MSLAVIQGASGSIGTAIVRDVLARSSLNVVATSRNPEEARERILAGTKLDSSRLTVLPMDIMEEGTIEKAAKDCKDRWGKGSLRLLINVSGVVSNIKRKK